MDKEVRNKKGFNPEVGPGSKVVLYYMEDSHGLSPGAKGVVISSIIDPFEPENKIINVKWENGSTLSLLTGIDVYKLDKSQGS